MTKDEQMVALFEQQGDTNKRLMVLVENLAGEVVKLANRTAVSVEEPRLPCPEYAQYEAPARGTYPPETDEPSKPQIIETEIPMPDMPERNPPAVDSTTSGPGEGPG